MDSNEHERYDKSFRLKRHDTASGFLLRQFRGCDLGEVTDKKKKPLVGSGFLRMEMPDVS